ncbi:short neurotoxin 342-like [Asterias rubens]|uniref:short neurotoxin 342-like n=1 Tax=Asterias rubens TaxID=7604 RepID=UPI001455A4E7|nr:short neurotoxin 342-like [Asterias rubens]
MRVLCVLLILAVIGHSLALKCKKCTGAACAAKLTSGDCTESFCYRKSKEYVLLEAGCGTTALCTKEECKSESNGITKCCCKKDDCNSAGAVTFNLVALVTLVTATFVF